MLLRFRDDSIRIASCWCCLLLLGLCLTATSCGSKAPAKDPNASAEVEDPEEAQRKLAELRETDFKDRLARLHAVAQKDPDNYDNRLQNIRNLKSQYPNKGAQLDALLEETRTEMLAHAEKLLADHFKEIDTLIEQADFAAAEDAMALFLEGLPQQGMTVFDDTPSFQAWQEKSDQVSLMKGAEGEASTARGNADSAARRAEYARAVAILDGYPNVYHSTKYYPEIEELKQEYYALYKESKQEAAKKAAIPWIDATVDEYLSSWHARGEDVWKADGDAIVGDNTTDNPASLVFADGDQWIDFNLRFEVKLSDGVLNLGLHKHVSRPGYSMNTCDVEGSDDWVPIVVTIEENRFRITRGDTFEELDSGKFHYNYPKGTFMLGLKPGEKLSLRKVQYQIISSDEEAVKEEDS